MPSNAEGFRLQLVIHSDSEESSTLEMFTISIVSNHDYAHSAEDPSLSLLDDKL